MMHWIRAHQQACGGALKKFRSSPVTSIMVALVIGITLSLPAALYLGVENLQRLSGSLDVEPEITLFLATDTPAETIQQIKQKLQSTDNIQTARFVSRDEAWKILQSRSSLTPSALGLNQNPLPDAFVIRAKDNAPAIMEALRTQLATWPHVEHVQLDADWVKRLYLILNIGHQLVVLLSALLGLAMIATIGNIIRLQILTQREEIEVSALIGATGRFIRRPFLYAGTWQGLLGGVTAWLIVRLECLLFNRSLAALASSYQVDFHLTMLDWKTSLSLITCAALMGWLGALIAVNRYLSRLAS